MRCHLEVPAEERDDTVGGPARQAGRGMVPLGVTAGERDAAARTCDVPGRPRTGQSARSVTVGSTRAALRDGSQLATSATPASSAATPTNVAGSLALTS